MDKQLTARLRAATGRQDLIVERRPDYGWYVVERGFTLMGFNSRRLLRKYIDNVELKGHLYTPTARETYG